MIDFSQKLNELSIRPLKGEYSVLSETQKARLVDFDFPEDYKNFLMHFPQTSVFDQEVSFSGKQASPSSDNGIEFLDVLFATYDDVNNDLLSLNSTYSDQMPRNLFVIGEVTGSNFVCLDLRSGFSVKLWDKSVSGNVDDCLFDIADSFHDFIMLLRVHDELSSDLKSPDLISHSTSDELRAKAREFLKKEN